MQSFTTCLHLKEIEGIKTCEYYCDDLTNIYEGGICYETSCPGHEKCLL